MATYERTADGWGEWEKMEQKEPPARLLTLFIGRQPIALHHIPTGAWLQRIEGYWYLMWME